MFRNDLAQKLSYRRLKPFMPDIAVFDERMPDRAEITGEPDNSARLPEDKKRELTEQVREVCCNFDGSIGWLYIPDTSINYPSCIREITIITCIGRMTAAICIRGPFFLTADARGSFQTE